jgi:lysozyme
VTTSENGIKFIKGNEGYAGFAYNDVGHWAWGYGHDQQPGESLPASVTIANADALLRKDLSTRFEPPLNHYLDQHGLTLTQNQWDAWVDFAYNLGTTAAVTMIAHGIDQVPDQMPRWNHVNGKENTALTRRRAAEVQLWRTT